MITAVVRRFAHACGFVLWRRGTAPGLRRSAVVLAVVCACALPVQAAVYRCPTPRGVVFSDLGCTGGARVPLGRMAGTVDPLSDAERAAVERLAERAPSRARQARAASRRCEGGGGECAKREPTAERERSRAPARARHRGANARAKPVRARRTLPRRAR